MSAPLLARDVTVVRASWRSDICKLAAEADGVMIGNGPGDPKDLHPLIAEIRNLLEHYDKPVFGVCLGHQILSLAAGANTYKLKYGHRGVNQPVQDLLTRQCLHHQPESWICRSRRQLARGLGTVVRQSQ